MTENEVRKVINGQRWVFAKSYAAFAPHEYIIRGKCNATDEEFVNLCNYILEKGVRMFYYKHERKYLFLDGHFYWLMSKKVTDDTAVINRCKPEDYDIVFVQRGTQAKKYGKSGQMELPLDEMR